MDTTATPSDFTVEHDLSPVEADEALQEIYDELDAVEERRQELKETQQKRQEWGDDVSEVTAEIEEVEEKKRSLQKKVQKRRRAVVEEREEEAREAWATLVQRAYEKAREAAVAMEALAAFREGFPEHTKQLRPNPFRDLRDVRGSTIATFLDNAERKMDGIEPRGETPSVEDFDL